MKQNKNKKIQTWFDLNENDDLYIYLPEINNRIIKYNCQKSYVINIKKSNSIAIIKLKYTDFTNHRRRIIFMVQKEDKENPILAIIKNGNYASYRDNLLKVGNTFVSFQEPEIFKEVYKEIIKKKKIELENIIKVQQEYLNNLDLIDYDNL